MSIRAGAMAITTSASRHARNIIMIVMPHSTDVPHDKSSIAQAMMRERFEQSLVIRAISQPTALRS